MVRSAPVDAGLAGGRSTPDVPTAHHRRHLDTHPADVQDLTGQPADHVEIDPETALACKWLAAQLHHDTAVLWLLHILTPSAGSLRASRAFRPRPPPALRTPRPTPNARIGEQQRFRQGGRPLPAPPAPPGGPDPSRRAAP